jgi:guanidinoacetate N-methyltransferase
MENKKFRKNDEFLSQVPNWEEKYKNSDDIIVDYTKNDWKSAKAHFSEKKLTILGCAVMEDWETPYMKVLAEIAASKSGVVLELGYGMGISARFIHERPISRHIIIEANHDVAGKARDFAANANIATTILEGLWEDVIEAIPDNYLDGILFDTYPLSEQELYQNHFGFFPLAYRKLKSGGVFTYYSDEVSEFGKIHLAKLEDAGFQQANVKKVVVNVVPPPDCEYWKADTILAPIVEKQ